MHANAEFIRAQATKQAFAWVLDPVESGVHLREVIGHKEAVSFVGGDSTSIGLITCSKIGYEVKVWDPKSLDLWLVLDQLSSVPDPLCTHPNPFVAD